MPRLLLAALVISLSLSIPAGADCHYASHTGTSTYPYTSWETAADSIQKAINAGSAGDTIYVGSGVWEEERSQPEFLYTLYDSLSIIGHGMDSTIIRQGYHQVWLHFLDLRGHNLVRGFAFDGTDPSYRSDAIHGHLHAQDLTISDNLFVNLRSNILLTDNSGRIANNLLIGGDIDAGWGGAAFELKNNTFTGGHDPISAYGGRWSVTNNVFHHNPSADYMNLISINAFGNQDTAYIANNWFFENLRTEPNNESEIIAIGPRSYLENNTFVGLPGSLKFIAVVASSRPRNLQKDLDNNIISCFRWPLKNLNDTIPLRLFYNDLWEYESLTYPFGGDIDTVAGNLFREPMFMDSLDFHLQAYSPLIDAGDPNILDLDGSRSDMGVYGGPLGQMYSYFDLPPRTPDSLRATVFGDSILLTWRMNTEADFLRYIVNRDTIPGFIPWAGNIVSEPDTNAFVDLDWNREHDYYYKIAAYDNQWSLSPYSTELSVINVGLFGEEYLLPQVTYLEGNYPNPFNSQTTIRYHLSDIGYQPAEVRLFICDITGRLIRTLVDTRQYPGDYRISWDGLSEGGEAASSGVYFLRLTVSGCELSRARKITLIR